MRAEPIGRHSRSTTTGRNSHRDTSIVVPAKAGTHNHRRLSAKKLLHAARRQHGSAARGYRPHPLSRGRRMSLLPARRADFGKPLADAQQQAVADLAIGLQLLLAIALGAGRILGRPVFDSAASVRVSSSALWCASGDSVMMRSKLSPSQSSSSSNVIGLWPEISWPSSAITATANGSSSPFLAPADFTYSACGKHVLQQAFRHRRTHAVQAACEQHGLRSCARAEARPCARPLSALRMT